MEGLCGWVGVQVSFSVPTEYFLMTNIHTVHSTEKVQEGMGPSFILSIFSVVHFVISRFILKC